MPSTNIYTKQQTCGRCVMHAGFATGGIRYNILFSHKQDEVRLGEGLLLALRYAD